MSNQSTGVPFMRWQTVDRQSSQSYSSHATPLFSFPPSRRRKRTLSDSISARFRDRRNGTQNGRIADEKERSKRRNYRDMYGRFRSNDDNTPRRKEFTNESGGIINRRAVTPFILTARDRPIDSRLMLGSIHHKKRC